MTGSIHEPAISCLAWWQIANGRTATFYAPADGVRRDAMASFVTRAILRFGGTLPDAPPDAFTDDGSSVHHVAINQLAAVGIVGGTGGGQYSPARVVTRGQMARFLANAAKHMRGTELPVTKDFFPDDAGSLFEPDINRVAAAGITGGRADGRYDPSGLVSRDQMGSFLARLLAVFIADGGLPVAQLSGGQEVPANDSRATGLAVLRLSRDGTALAYRLVVANIRDVNMAHIHLAPRGANGPVVAWLYPEGPPPLLLQGRSQGVIATGTLTAASLVGPLRGMTLSVLLEEIRAGQAYVNVHTLPFPAGEIRGQLG